MVLDLDPNREPVAPRDAATLVLVRDAPGGLEVFCVERHQKSAFMGGAIVFPGGKVDTDDADPAWEAVTTPPAPRAERAHAIAAARESLEEAAILPVTGGRLAHDELLAMRKIPGGAAIRDALRARGLTLDLARLHPLARWITPVAESRRFDARFFLCVAPEGQPGAHDEHETTRSFWACPREVLAQFDDGRVQLMPPTHRTLELLAEMRAAEDALAACARATLEPICPRLVRAGDTAALVLPGDPEHDVREPRVAGKSRYVLRGARWVPEDP